ncbi:MAG TPA: thiamine biosynthesis protein ThiF [Planctomycetaceae bacterium]|nr:thiamine biosynthesis protein ThiF [Planctomycetaceae bacterium]
MVSEPNTTDRYIRQERFAPLGETGQTRLRSASAAIVGCGALGSMIAERLGRAGVGRLRLIDRDWVELSNLQRQTLYTQVDASEAVPKAVAASQHLAAINSDVAVQPIVADLIYENVRSLLSEVDLVIDGTDNFPTRFLINDFAVQTSTPWVHGGCLGASGQVLSIVPGATACLRCLIPEPPPPSAVETCDSAGVLGPAVGLVACWQAAEALKILSGNAEAICDGLIVIDSWQTQMRVVQLPRDPNCPCCGKHEFPYLNGMLHQESTVLCGKNAVQILLGSEAFTNFSDAEVRLTRVAGQAAVQANPYFVRAGIDGFTITIFRGGRTVVEGTEDVTIARSLVAKTLGS